MLPSIHTHTHTHTHGTPTLRKPHAPWSRAYFLPSYAHRPMTASAPWSLPIHPLITFLSIDNMGTFVSRTHVPPSILATRDIA